VGAGRARGVGLNNVQKRLHAHYGSEASLSLTSRIGEGTRVTLRLPGSPMHRPNPHVGAEMTGQRR
jgi:sensor histidine kinase YesM